MTSELAKKFACSTAGS